MPPKINLVVVGHVDSGKSTLVGHLLFKLGQIDKKKMHRLEVDSQRSGKSSFKFAWAMDETGEERARGVTIDIAMTQFMTPRRDVILLDAPGHVDFVPAVISGAAQADAAILVVDATRGEFETGFNHGGQTREHTALVRSLGIKSLIVVVNKMDNVDWSWDRFSDIKEQLMPFLKKLSYDTKSDVQFVACSGLTGENLIESRFKRILKDSSHPQLESEGADWSTVPSLIDAIDNINPPERLIDKPTRVSITDVYKGMTSGVSIGGRVIAGKLEPNQKLLLQPQGETCEVKQVECQTSERSSKALVGDIIVATIAGVDIGLCHRGCVLSDPQTPCTVTNRIMARVITFQNIPSILVEGMPIELHINGIFESGKVRKLVRSLNKSTGELLQRRPRCVAKNSSAIVQFELGRSVCCDLYEQNKDLGRFMIRSMGTTVATCVITRLWPPKLGKKTKMINLKLS